MLHGDDDDLPPPEPHVNARDVKRGRRSRLYDILLTNCFPKAIDLKKQLRKYDALPDEYYSYDQGAYFTDERFRCPQHLAARGHYPGQPVQLWELMAGSGRLSSTARTRGMSHLPPVDYRWGVNLGFEGHQMPILWSMLTYPVDVLFAAPYLYPLVYQRQSLDRGGPRPPEKLRDKRT